MRDRAAIWFGLAVFLALFTFPFWRDLSAAATTRGPEPVLPAREKQCVAPLAYMKTSHMTLLLDWRDEVVRRDGRTFAAYNGRTYTMNLTSTCLSQCHAKRADFCDRCHNYAAVNVPCWDCHTDSPPVLRSAR